MQGYVSNSTRCGLCEYEPFEAQAAKGGTVTLHSPRQGVGTETMQEPRNWAQRVPSQYFLLDSLACSNLTLYTPSGTSFETSCSAMGSPCGGPLRQRMLAGMSMKMTLCPVATKTP